MFGFQQYCCLVGDYAYDLLILVFQSLWLSWLGSQWLCCTPVQEGPSSDVKLLLVHAVRNSKLCMSWQMHPQVQPIVFTLQSPVCPHSVSVFTGMIIITPQTCFCLGISQPEVYRSFIRSACSAALKLTCSSTLQSLGIVFNSLLQPITVVTWSVL